MLSGTTMDLIKTGKVLSYCYNYLNTGLGSLLHQKSNSIISIRTYAARKGYREAARKKKTKQVIQKQVWIPHNLRKKGIEDVNVTRRCKENDRSPAVDDVWISKEFSWRVYDFKEAVECHRETLHPTMYNVPDAQLNAFIELDMSTAKPTKFVEKFNRMAILPHIFQQDGLQERSVLVFCKTPEQREEAQNAGANLVGGTEIIKAIEKGKIVLPDFRFVIAHPSILPEMVTIRGFLKRKFPSIRAGTLGPNVGELVTQFKNGVEYSCLKNNVEPEYGWIETPIGRLNMDIHKMEENLIALINDINLQKPRRPGRFITRIVAICPPSRENFKLNIKPYIQEDDLADDESSDEDEAVPAKM